jgi:hypothetical protein
LGPQEENRAIERLFADQIDVHATSAKNGNLAAFGSLAEDLKDLWQIDAHYGKKENLCSRSWNAMASPLRPRSCGAWMTRSVT